MRGSNIILMAVLLFVWLLLYTVNDFHAISIMHPFVAFVLGVLVCIIFNEIEETF